MAKPPEQSEIESRSDGERPAGFDLPVFYCSRLVRSAEPQDWRCAALPGGDAGLPAIKDEDHPHNEGSLRRHGASSVLVVWGRGWGGRLATIRVASRAAHGVGGSGSVGGDDDLAEGALAEGVEGGLRLVQREDPLDGHSCLAAGHAVADPVKHLAGGVGVYRDHGRCLGGHLLRALQEGRDEPASVTYQFDNARVPGKVGEDVDPVRCYRADL